MSGEIPIVGENVNDSWDSLIDTSHDMPTSFEGERNLNSKTGRERTRSDFDLYPRIKIKTEEGEERFETPKEYGERLRSMHQKTAEYLAAHKDESENPTDERENEALSHAEEIEEPYYNRIVKKIDLAVKEGRITEFHKKNLMELLDRVYKNAPVDKDIPDQKELTDDDRAYESWLQSREVLNQENLKVGPQRVIYEDGKKIIAEESPEPILESVKAPIFEPSPESQVDPESPEGKKLKLEEIREQLANVRRRREEVKQEIKRNSDRIAEIDGIIDGYEPSPSNTPEFKVNDSLLDRARARASSIPAEGLTFITEENDALADVYSAEKATQYQKWWDSQNETVKNNVINLLNYITKDPDYSSTNWGRSFINWLRNNHGDMFN